MGRAWVGVILGLLVASSAWAAEVHEVRLWRAPDHTRIVFDLTGPATHKIIVLDNPRRIVLDLQDTSLKASLAGLKLDNTPVSRIRSATGSSASCFRELMATSAPAWAKATAIASPIPRLAPVTRATLPLS